MLADLLATSARELAFFSGVGFLLFALDELFVDLAWFVQAALKAGNRAAEPTIAVPAKTLIAVFVPSWQESEVIGAMLRHACSVWPSGSWTLFAGCYPNDRMTVDAVARVGHPNIRIVINERPGPTTKGDCLNAVWRDMQCHERETGQRYEAIVLHDAEDMVDGAELETYAAALEYYAQVQLPVLPEIDPQSRWISGHYIDEFAEAHSRDLVVRQAIGASLPLAGVGCALRRDAIEALAVHRGGLPFEPNSLTEDYDMGLMLGELGFKSTFVRRYAHSSGNLVAVRAHFPASFETAIRQKSRWTQGIALLGWRNLGWSFRPAELWMRLRDRRTILSALLITTGYVSLLLGLAHMLIVVLVGGMPNAPDPLLLNIWLANSAMLLWRAFIRALCVGRLYGWHEALRSMPRMMTSSFISVAAARRAVTAYLKHLRTGVLSWDKTEHVFPTGGRP